VTKRYDRAYFDKWYRSARRVHAPGELRRKVALAVATSEYFLRRTIRSVLDVGCGEAPWFVELRAIRPRVSYIGLDPSDYVVARFGKSRHVRKASFAELPSLSFLRRFDLVVCSDVLHYVDERDIRPGIEALARFAGGVAFFEVLTADDDIVGDLEGLVRRPGAFYRRVFGNAGFLAAGPYLWLAPEIAGTAAALEHHSGA
jgi:SAM-dependent methyltransferase